MNFIEKEVAPKRSVVFQRVGAVKTEASGKPVPLDDQVIAELLRWREESAYAADSDYVFASEKANGKRPLWPSKVMQHSILPVAKRLGIQLKGFHTMRHSLATVLRQNGVHPKVAQGLLRHSTYRTTVEIYDASVAEEQRTAHAGLVRSLHLGEFGVPDGI